MSGYNQSALRYRAFTGLIRLNGFNVLIVRVPLYRIALKGVARREIHSFVFQKGGFILMT